MNDWSPQSWAEQVSRYQFTLNPQLLNYFTVTSDCNAIEELFQWIPKTTWIQPIQRTNVRCFCSLQWFAWNWWTNWSPENSPIDVLLTHARNAQTPLRLSPVEYTHSHACIWICMAVFVLHNAPTYFFFSFSSLCFLSSSLLHYTTTLLSVWLWCDVVDCVIYQCMNVVIFCFGNN